MKRAATAIALALALGACSDGGGSGNPGADYEIMGMLNDSPFAAAPAPASEGRSEVARIELQDSASSPIDVNRPIIQPDPDGGGGAPPGMAPLMAYTYAWDFSVPTENMQGLQGAHRKLCEDAGPQNCYVTASSLDAIGKAEGASGYLSLRATEAWVRGFEKGVGEGLGPFGGSIYSTNRSAEELTAQIVDNEARLKSMVAHRDALQKMVEAKPGRLSDLLEIEQALAEAQGDIDSRQSLLAALKLRVSMSVLNFNYQPEYAAVSNSIWRPIGDAFGDFGPAFARTIAGIVRFVAAALPVLVLAGLGIWGALAIFRWRGRGKASRPVATPAKTGPGA